MFPRLCRAGHRRKQHGGPFVLKPRCRQAPCFVEGQAKGGSLTRARGLAVWGRAFSDGWASLMASGAAPLHQSPSAGSGHWSTRGLCQHAALGVPGAAGTVPCPSHSTGTSGMSYLLWVTLGTAEHSVLDVSWSLSPHVACQGVPHCPKAQSHTPGCSRHP